MTERVPALLGIPEARIDAAEKVTGRVRYAADIARPGMLHAAFLLSPHPHARIVGVDVGRARALAGVRALLTGADVRPARLGRRLMDWPVLAWERVRFVGDRVAAVAADDAATAEEACRHIDVEYEPLPAVLDPEEALRPDAPILHPDAAEHVYLGGTRPAVPHPNVQGLVRHEHGDVDAAFARDARKFEHEFETARVHQGFLEPRASLVWFEGEVLHVLTTNKAPFPLRDQLARALALAPERIVVETALIGGDFGGKGLSFDEFALAFLARATGRPVRSLMSYVDELRATNPRHAARLRLRTAVDAEGRILAHEARVLLDGGAYASGKPGASLVVEGATGTLAGYRVPASRVEAISVYTNTVPAGHVRAPGQPQTAFASESHVDLIARALGMDPLEFRIKNAARPGDPVVGGTFRSARVPEILERVRAEAGPRPVEEARGRGYALGVRHVGRGKTQIALEVDRDGAVEAVTNVTDQGGGVLTVIQRVVAAELGIAPERVHVRRGSTAEAPQDPGVGGSRATPVHGGAALAAARALRERLAELMPDLAVPDAIDRVSREARVRVVGEHEVRRDEGDDVSVCAYAIDVEVDRETGAVRVLDALLVADTGTVINPLMHRGQLEGGFVFGLGTTLMEELVVEDGRVVTAHLGEYRMPTIADVPPLRIVLLEPAVGPGPYGAKSVGELANPSVGPAIANAVHDAVGARVLSLPITAPKVFAAIAKG